MNKIIAILIFVKVIGITSHAKAEFSSEDFIKYKGQLENEFKEKEREFKKEWIEEKNIITRIDDDSYIVENYRYVEAETGEIMLFKYKKKYCITNIFDQVNCWSK
tara:strand:+ start:146 stop:460 length:315 start_codon:yes stop_codon:yes gene_type:complete